MSGQHTPSAPSASSRALLWIALAVGLVVNVAGSTGALPLVVGIVGGLVTAAAAVGLVGARVRRR
ncbi:hypothetical protein [Kineococcus sp. SYSU DK003]|uniref:hypothetical protein n=1 Tax=Kineococcus sp. SYSU DK003 TaxID=3383124 RepID=UPI003D7E8401